MKELANVLKLARAAKLEAKKKAEEEAKRKEALQSQPMTGLSNLAEAIKIAK
jgi:hypothetical protein